MLRLFAILSTLALVLIAALVAHAQDGKQKLSIGQCYKTFNCSFSEKGTDVQGFRNGNNHVGCNGEGCRYPPQVEAAQLTPGTILQALSTPTGSTLSARLVSCRRHRFASLDNVR